MLTASTRATPGRTGLGACAGVYDVDSARGSGARAWAAPARGAADRGGQGAAQALAPEPRADVDVVDARAGADPVRPGVARVDAVDAGHRVPEPSTAERQERLAVGVVLRHRVDDLHPRVALRERKVRGRDRHPVRLPARAEPARAQPRLQRVELLQPRRPHADAPHVALARPREQRVERRRRGPPRERHPNLAAADLHPAHAVVAAARAAGDRPRQPVHPADVVAGRGADEGGAVHCGQASGGPATRAISGRKRSS